MTFTEFEPLLDCKAVAQLLGLHPKTVEKMARKKQIPAMRIGDLWRFRLSELDAWCKHQVTSKSPLVSKAA
jgi:excisionase family DNA binding protein